MSHFEKFFSRLERAVTGQKDFVLILALDYDGTLAPFNANPMHAFPYNGVMGRLTELSQLHGARPVIVTGRRCYDIPQLLKMPPEDLEVWGWHGKAYKRRGSDALRYVPVPETMRRGLEQVRATLMEMDLGSDLEVKLPFSFAVHWRSLVEAGKHDEAAERERIITHLFYQVSEEFGLHMKPGNMLLEIEAPVGSKADAVYALVGSAMRSGLRRPKDVFIIAAGDDKTDEDMFQALRELRKSGHTTLSVRMRDMELPTIADLMYPRHEALLALMDHCYEVVNGRRMTA